MPRVKGLGSAACSPCSLGQGTQWSSAPRISKDMRESTELVLRSR